MDAIVQYRDEESRSDNVIEYKDAIPLLLAEFQGSSFLKLNPVFVLGTDEDIEGERRVGLIPEQVACLNNALKKLGLEPQIYTVKGCGNAAGYTDDAYKSAGAMLVEKADVGNLPEADVVHALKEPTEYEAQIPGDFARIGALHIPVYPPGVRALLREKRSVGCMNGATTGDCSFLRLGWNANPIVGSMSVAAAIVAVGKMLELGGEALRRGRVIIVGAGVIGVKALTMLATDVEEVVVCEPLEDRREVVKLILGSMNRRYYRIEETLSASMLQEAQGIVFCHRARTGPTPFALKAEDVRKWLRPGTVVADIGIDQGGSIDIGQHGDPPMEVADTRRRTEELVTAAGGQYYAEVNMPRELPNEASRWHGQAALPYVLCLMLLSARLGCGTEVLRYLHGLSSREYRAADDTPNSITECIVQDLRNGLEFVKLDGQLHILHSDHQSNPNSSQFLTDSMPSC